MYDQGVTLSFVFNYKRTDHQKQGSHSQESDILSAQQLFSVQFQAAGTKDQPGKKRQKKRPAGLILLWQISS
jgi:hypothetical protein